MRLKLNPAGASGSCNPRRAAPASLVSISVAALLAAAHFCPEAARAADQPASAGAGSAAADSASAGRELKLETVVVTAQRRKQNLQDVPMSVQAIPKQQLELEGITTGQDLNAMVPNLSVGSDSATGLNDTVTIRGIPEVGLYVDGIWQPDVGFRQAGIVEMERVEILRGPQGTLFGRNTNGGAINYITVPPAAKFGLHGSLETGDFDHRFANVSVDIPLGDKLLTKWTGAIQHQGGWLKSVSNNQEYGGYDNKVYRGDVLWKPADNFSVRLTDNQTNYSGTTARVASFTNVNPSTVNDALTTLYNVATMNPAYGPYNFWNGSTEWLSRFKATGWSPQHDSWNYPGGRVGEWETTNDEAPDSQGLDETQYTATVQWEISPELRITSLSSYLTQVVRNYTNYLGGDIGGLRNLTMLRSDYRSEELHLEGDIFHDKVHYLVGGYYLNTQQRQRSYRWNPYEFFIANPNAPPNSIVTSANPPIMDPTLRSFINAWVANNPGNPAVAQLMQNPLFWHNGFSMSNLSAGQQPSSATDYNNMLTDDTVQDYSLFANAVWHVTGKLELQGGVRAAWDGGTNQWIMPLGAYRTFLTPEMGGGAGYGPGPLFVGNQVELSRKPYTPGAVLTPMFTASYHWTPDRMVFVRYAQGYTQGTTSYNAALGQNITLQPEVVHDYETGVRTDWLDHHLRADVTGYWMLWDGMQIEQSFTLPNGTFVIANTSGGSGRARGVEAQVQAAPLPGLQIGVSGALLDTSWLTAGTGNVQPGTPWAYAPKWTYHLFGQYDYELPNQADITLRADYGHVGSYQLDSQIQRQIPGGEPAYGLLNARIQYTPPDGHWNAQIYGTNLTNVAYITAGLDDADSWGAGFQTIGQRRMIGLRLDFDL